MSDGMVNTPIIGDDEDRFEELRFGEKHLIKFSCMAGAGAVLENSILDTDLRETTIEATIHTAWNF